MSILTMARKTEFEPGEAEQTSNNGKSRTHILTARPGQRGKSRAEYLV